MKALKKTLRSMDIQQFIIGASVLFSTISALLGNLELSIGIALSVVTLFVFGAMLKDLKEFADELKE